MREKEGEREREREGGRKREREGGRETERGLMKLTGELMLDNLLLYARFQYYLTIAKFCPLTKIRSYHFAADRDDQVRFREE